MVSHRVMINAPRLSHICLAAGLSLAALAGCNAPQATNTEESNAAGRTATIELRPILTSDTSSLHKQRAGKLVKVTSNWVVIDEEGTNTEIWIPRDIVLEIRMSK